MSPIIPVAVILGSYLLGSIPTGLLVARARGVDIRAVGSGNIGATNVSRSLGKKLGALVLLADAIKGFAPVFAVSRWLPPAIVAAAGFAAIAGHVFPVWLRFRGGKGVATGLGVFAAVAPIAAAAAVVVYFGTVLVTRISSVGSLAAATALLAAMGLLHHPLPHLVLGIVVWALIVWRHRDNIRRLIRREEGKL
jgi:acyl phosphate:glycerol-3-phosphate acyltransferase